MKVVIIDDERSMLLIMKRMLAKITEVEIVGMFQDTSTAYSYLLNYAVDLIFIDVNMPKESGLEFAERLLENGLNTKLVYVTSHKEYALPAFDVYAFDYMVKPVNQERLQRTILRALSEKSPALIPVKQDSSSANVMFYCLGGMEIRSAQNVLVKWKTKKSAELFGYLLVKKGRLVSRARIIEDLFGELPQKNGEIYLNTTVYQLRKLLGSLGLKEILYSDSNHYALNLKHLNVDFLHFEEGCKRLAIMNDTDIEQALELEQLYTGDLFGEREFPWARNEIERLSVMYTTFTHRLCDALISTGDAQTAIQLLKRLTERDELNELTVKLHMRALAFLKNKEALEQLYLHSTETFQQELGISSFPAVTALYDTLKSELDR